MKKIYKTILQVVLAISTIVGLYLYSNRKKLFPPNPYKLNYTKIAKLGNIIDKGVSPKGEKTFFITFGSRNCPACTQLYQTMYEYNKQAKGKTAKDGFIPFWTTDIVLEAEAASLFAYDYILDNKWVKWDGKGGTFSRLDDIVTPTIFFIKDGKLEEMIVDTTLNVDKVINYVKRQKNL